MSNKITGKLIVKGETQVVSEKFKKREFVLELTEEINGNSYTNFAKLQLTQAKCDILDRYKLGETLECHYNIKGTKFEKDGKTSYFTNLDCWKIEYPNGMTNGSQTNSTSTATPTVAERYANPNHTLPQENKGNRGVAHETLNNDLSKDLPF